MARKTKNSYVGDMVLGMHDALVSLTGLIAGLAFSMAERRMIILSSIIASVAASLSMAASNYLACRTVNHPAAIKSGLYTGTAYLATCVLLIMPFVFIRNRGWELATTFGIAVLIIFGFNFCVAKMQRRPFIRPFLEMLTVCACVSVIAFIIGQAAGYFLGVDI